MPAAYWKGALELGGYPINVGLCPRVKSRSGDSFKTLDSKGRPCKKPYVSIEEDGEIKIVPTAETQKGIEIGPDDIRVLPPETLEAIAELERTEVAPMVGVYPRDTVPFEFAVSSYTVIPDKKVPGSKMAYDQLWNSLRGGNLVFCTQITMRAGQRDVILAVYANEDGLYAITLPFAVELHEKVAVAAPEVDDEAQAKFAGVELPAFDHEQFTSNWREVRNAAIEAALDGKPLPKPKKAPEPPVEKPNLSDVLAGVVATTGAEKAKPKAKAKPRAKKPAVKKDPVRGKSKVTA